jgi:protein phosphatase PTC2/3
MFGPHRVFPGRLSVSRTFGDIEAKRYKYKGNPRVVISIPEVKCFKVEETYDYILLGCDGIFDKLTSEQVIKAAWEKAKKKFENRE